MSNGDGQIHEGRPRAGASPSGVRDHNERAILTVLRERGAMSGAEIARALGVSAQTASVILRVLEDNGLVVKGDPIKGKVGKPQVPYTLNPDGAFSLGLRIGRRNADLLLVDLVGTVRAQRSTTYPYPTPPLIEGFVQSATTDLLAATQINMGQIEGLGVAAPFELWNWLDALGAPKAEAELWRDYSIAENLARIISKSVHVANDVNMACTAERLFGAGQTLPDFAYFYVGSFVGGGLVLNGQVFHGGRGNAGAFGSILVPSRDQKAQQLIHSASLYTLERAIAGQIDQAVNLRAQPDLFETQTALVETWRQTAARSLASAMAAVVAVLDLRNIVLDGAFPDTVRDALIDDTRCALNVVDKRGLNGCDLEAGLLGQKAGARGAAFDPIMRTHFLEGITSH